MTGAHRAGGRWFRAPRGRAAQPEHGRHSPEYLAAVEPDRGLYPMGEAQRVSWAAHIGDNAQDIETDDRGDRLTWRPPVYAEES